MMSAMTAFQKDLLNALSDEELDRRIAKEQRKIDAMERLREMLGPVFAAHPGIPVRAESSA
jgi:hypothetical protein